MKILLAKQNNWAWESQKYSIQTSEYRTFKQVTYESNNQTYVLPPSALPNHWRVVLVCSRTGANERVFRTNEPNRFVSLVRSFVSFTIRFTGNSTERTNEFPVALTPLSLTDSTENRAMACIPWCDSPLPETRLNRERLLHVQSSFRWINSPETRLNWEESFTNRMFVQPGFR